MSEPKPIPLICYDNAGSGFVVTDGDSVWLMTCLHLLTGPKKLILENIDFQNSKVRVAGTAIDFGCFRGGNPTVSVVERPDCDLLVDAISINLSPDEASCLTRYGMYDARSIVQAQMGENVRMSGFPSPEDPPRDSQNMRATVTQMDEFRLALSEPSAHGMSGGPVVSDRGLVGLVYGDAGHIPAEFRSAHAVSLHVVAPYLLKST